MTLQEFAALAAKATPGPWKNGRRNDPDAPASIYREPHEGQAYAVAMCPRYGLKDWNKGNGDFIAACSPERIAALVAVIEAADAMHERDDPGWQPYDAKRAELDALP